MTNHLKNLLLPMLLVVYPILYIYNNNVKLLNLGNLIVPIVGGLLLAVILFGLFLFFFKSSLKAGLATSIFLVFFYAYGIVVKVLLKLDWFPVEHYTLLPVIIVMGCYAGYFSSFLTTNIANPFRNILLLTSSGLIFINVVTIVPVEIQKAQVDSSSTAQVVQGASSTAQKYPDIYFIIFDEYASFDSIREYWHDDYVDEFEAYLKEKGFFVAGKSNTKTNSTLIEMASRLNLTQYPAKTNHLDLYDAIADNLVMQTVKSYGYTTVVFNPIFHPFEADIEYVYNPKTMGSTGSGADEFTQTILDQTMFSVFADLYRASDPVAIANHNMLKFSIKGTANLADVESPKFVYTHLAFPHLPFILNEMGGPVDPKYKYNWNYYLGQHKYATKLAKQLVTELLEKSNPQNPPVIILQSDHGARNVKLKTIDNVLLENFDKKYHTSVLNALYLPGFDYSQLTEDVAPIETFVIVLNHYLNANLAVEPPKP